MTLTAPKRKTVWLEVAKNCGGVAEHVSLDADSGCAAVGLTRAAVEELTRQRDEGVWRAEYLVLCYGVVRRDARSARRAVCFGCSVLAFAYCSILFFSRRSRDHLAISWSQTGDSGNFEIGIRTYVAY